MSGSGTSGHGMVRAVVAVVLMIVLVALFVFALIGPVTADVTQPTPPGYRWEGVPPTVSVDCGSLLSPQKAQWPAATRHIDRADRRSAQAACVQARSSSRTMAWGTGAAIVLMSGLVAVVARRFGRRTTV